MQTDTINTVKKWVRPLCIPAIQAYLRRMAQGRGGSALLAARLYSLVQGARFKFETPTFFGVVRIGLQLITFSVNYFNFRYIVPFIVQFWMYISPVGFSSSIVPEKWRPLYSINPMVGVIDGFRWAIMGSTAVIYWPGFILSMLLVAVLLVAGVWYFRRMEKTFADVI